MKTKAVLQIQRNFLLKGRFLTQNFPFYERGKEKNHEQWMTPYVGTMRLKGVRKR